MLTPSYGRFDRPLSPQCAWVSATMTVAERKHQCPLALAKTTKYYDIDGSVPRFVTRAFQPFFLATPQPLGITP